MQTLPQTEYLADDGLEIPLVGPWAEEKYRIVSFYNRLFSTGMKNVWGCRAYIDLYAGAGYARINGTSRILRASPLLALAVPDQFDKYIFCEKSKTKLAALKKRVSRDFPGVDVSYILGDCNSKVSEILAQIPPYSRDRKVLSFCFVDPYNIGIHFETITTLSKVFMDFLIVLALGMDATRNEDIYRNSEDNYRIEKFLGLKDWRTGWSKAALKGVPFSHYLAQEYASQMASLGYLKVPMTKMKEVRSNDKNLSLYHLAFFSRSSQGDKFWNQVLKHTNPQTELNLFDQS